MYKNLHARLATIAEEDNDREELLGASCPSTLWLLLDGNHELLKCHLVDGLNSLDDETIDVVKKDEHDPERGICWVIPLAHIVAVRLRYPLEKELKAAKAFAVPDAAP